MLFLLFSLPFSTLLFFILYNYYNIISTIYRVREKYGTYWIKLWWIVKLCLLISDFNKSNFSRRCRVASILSYSPLYQLAGIDSRRLVIFPLLLGCWTHLFILTAQYLDDVQYKGWSSSMETRGLFLKTLTIHSPLPISQKFGNFHASKLARYQLVKFSVWNKNKNKIIYLSPRREIR